jgi:plastocyanin
MNRSGKRGIWLGAAAACALSLCAIPGSSGGAKQRAGTVAGKLTLKKGGAARSSAGGIVVYVDGVPGAADAVAARKARIEQKDLRFTPDLTVITVGSTVEFPNHDKIFHNVFSVSAPAKFDLGLYKSGTTKSVTFQRPGVVDVYCNIHPEMVAKIKVLDTPHHAVTGADGSFSIEGVPPGTYSIVAWQPYGAEHREEVTVQAGGTTSLAITLDEGSRPKRHLRKDGTPYGRYK